MRRLLWAIPVAAFFVNPSLACGPAPGPSYSYGAAELSAVVAGTWAFTFTPDGGAQTMVTVTVDQAAAAPATSAAASGGALVRAAYACGTRTLVRGAAACVDETQMPLAVTFVQGDPSLATATFSGLFTVVGTDFFQGTLELSLGPYHIWSQLLANGTLVGTQLSAPGPSGALTFVSHDPEVAR